MTAIQDLLSALHDKGWSWEAIADVVAVDYSTIYKWRRGIQAPSHEGHIRKVLEQSLRRKRIPKKKRYRRNPPPASDLGEAAYSSEKTP